MKIALISKLWEETSPYSKGGTGAVVGILTEELVKRGHDVTLFATGNSKTGAKLISARKKPWAGDYSEPIEFLNIAEAFSKNYDFDVINCFVEQKACFFADVTNTPALINISYGDFTKDDISVLKKYKHLNYVSVSKGLQELLPFLNWKKNIYHGIDVQMFPFNEKPQDYMLFLGRMSPQKGPHIAINIAKKLGKKLILAGKIVEEDKKYLERFVFPYMDGKNIVYKGVANFKEKLILFKNASVMLHPIQYFEAFGMTIIESMACGTPVISFNNGAPKEIIEEGKTGFVVNTEKEMMSAVKNVYKISRSYCRQSVENKFSAKLMTEKYEKLLNSIAKNVKI